jgi:hypothetical protein
MQGKYSHEVRLNFGLPSRMKGHEQKPKSGNRRDEYEGESCSKLSHALRMFFGDLFRTEESEPKRLSSEEIWSWTLGQVCS